MCGGEGYTESIATGHLAALFVWAKIQDKTLSVLPSTTACGALLKHITQSKEAQFTPSNINFGLFDTLPGNKRVGRKNKRLSYYDRALNDMKMWIRDNNIQVFV
jgi:methylenetetrahydrofolate--tRNA-(uracil-5-)-methyltransferase